jgi:hypothetical protein
MDMKAETVRQFFGANDTALLDVLTGKFNPGGKSPFALANSAEAIVRQAPDAAGYPAEDTLFPFGFRLGYPHHTALDEKRFGKWVGEDD